MLKILSTFKKSVYFFIVIIFFALLASQGKDFQPSELKYGITFSQKQAQDLGLNWKEMYIAMLDDLGIKKIRLSAYWNKVEPINNQYDWTDLDWQVDEASARNTEIILAIGTRLPRWPECHFPDWVDKNSTIKTNIESEEYIKNTIERYKNNKNIVAWQIENEPFLSNFGECPSPDANLLDKEIALARSLDNRPIIVTDSGELSIWVLAAKRADIFGTTMYRNTFSKHLNSYVRYPITPAFFKFKKNIASLFAHPKKWIVIELQGEPWSPVQFQDVTTQERNKTMSPEKFEDMITFINKTGFDEFYWWGVEWWYWEKTTQNNPFYWEKAKTLFNKN